MKAPFLGQTSASFATLKKSIEDQIEAGTANTELRIGDASFDPHSLVVFIDLDDTLRATSECQDQIWRSVLREDCFWRRQTLRMIIEANFNNFSIPDIYTCFFLRSILQPAYWQVTEIEALEVIAHLMELGVMVFCCTASSARFGCQASQARISSMFSAGIEFSRIEDSEPFELDVSVPQMGILPKRLYYDNGILFTNGCPFKGPFMTTFCKQRRELDDRPNIILIDDSPHVIDHAGAFFANPLAMASQEEQGFVSEPSTEFNYYGVRYIRPVDQRSEEARIRILEENALDAQANGILPEFKKWLDRWVAHNQEIDRPTYQWLLTNIAPFAKNLAP